MNAKEELLIHVKHGGQVLCLTISYGEGKYEQTFNLKIGFTEQEWNDLLNNLDFDYDDGYGGQELFGMVWLKDGGWLERGEYDGSEWWEYKYVPIVPEELL
jgi:hypothetical protein